MSISPGPDFSNQNKQNPRSSSDQAITTAPLFSGGIAIRCQHCSSQNFRRSALRIEDVVSILTMRYPVRCLRCGERQRVSFAVAGLSVGPGSRVKRAKHPDDTWQRWTEPKPTRSTETESTKLDSFSE
jgi:hypothetical protein